MRKLRIVEMKIFINCIIYFDVIMKKTVSLITILNCFHACKPWCIKITLKMFILRHMCLSKREPASNFLLDDILHDYVQKIIFAATSTLPPKATVLNTPFSQTRTHYLYVYPIFLALSKST